MAKDWSWLPKAMPEVAKLMAAQRAKLGAEHVQACWRLGVLHEVPGHFFAAEGGVTVGAPTPAQWLDWYEPPAGTQRPVAVLYVAEPGQAQGVSHAGA